MTLAARTVRDLSRKLSVRVASRAREACFEARDLGTRPCGSRPNRAREREIVRTEKLAAIGVRPVTHANRASFGESDADWPCERWGIDVDAPEDLLAACRLPLHAFTTHEPLRAMAARALVALAPHDDGPWPVQVPELEVVPGAVRSLRGDWSGEWSAAAHVRNPFPFACASPAASSRAAARSTSKACRPRSSSSPAPTSSSRSTCAAARGAPAAIPCSSRATAGSAGPVAAPAACSSTRRSCACGSCAPTLVATPRALAREPLRSASVDDPAPPGSHLHVAIENPGGARDARAVVHLDGPEITGAASVRATLPADFDTANGVRFSCGFVAWQDGQRTVRRWAGGVPDELDNGSPGRLLPLQRG